ncbi:MAG: penicillin-binding protein 2 [Bacillota bacterium]
MEKKVLEKRMKFFTYLLAVSLILLMARVGYMQIIEGNRYKTLATQNHLRLITVEAPRGEIIDRNGVRIVTNKPVYTVSLVYLGLEDSQAVIHRLSSLLAGESVYQGMTTQQIEQDIEEKIKGHTRLYEPVRVAVNVSEETINRIEEQKLELPGVNIDIEPVRSYPFNDLLGEVLGYVREITGEQLEANKDQGYRMGDSFGQVGLESTYEKYLRGVNGARQVEVDAQGRPVRDLGLKSPVPGNNLVLTIDSRLQRVAQDAVVAALDQAKRSGYVKAPAGKAVSGTAVALDVNTGEVLAMASVPSYDLNIFSGPLPASKYNELLNSGAMRNHAIQSTYTPGSTFKMAVASALLESNVVSVNDSIFDPGYFKYKKDWQPGGHGIVNIIKAIKYSCDTFFYTFGIQTTPEIMGKYAAEYGLGQLTGIDLPGEEPGRVASRELKKKIWAGNDWESEWHEYDSMDMAIGQQETKVTAIQLANYVAAIANGGTLYRPHLGKQIIAPDGSELMSIQPEVIRKIGVSQANLDIIREGMHEVVQSGGTAAWLTTGDNFTAAAKTGTAEAGEGAHALFVSYAPFEKPEIAVAVIIEYGGHGSEIAGPVAKKIMEAYFKFKEEDAAAANPQTTAAPQPAQAEPSGKTQPSGQSSSDAQTTGQAPSGQIQPSAQNPAGQTPAGRNTGGGGQARDNAAAAGQGGGQSGTPVKNDNGMVLPPENRTLRENTGQSGRN